MIDDFEERD
ncbi:hypothetical protein VIBNISOn1_890024 [Vibrio nigripulchritudo SOn1]|uniref:Uncharacterized protein n=1 Tax=Vibrio nigripulchritudo SOn1 TaxID=1238450 RepID=A0AAV2VZC6_9VIBR|nr:hypothetical protein VIBNISOn1_890024 [Vibrio nigripulchritudo SOn1]